MTSCPVCYEGYADEGQHVPHKLKCGDTMCFQCIDSELIDGEFYCPECGAAHKGERVIDFSIALMAADLGSKYTSDEGTSDEERSSRSSRSNSADSSPRYDSKHSSFGRRLSTRTPCKEPDCDKKAISNGYCLKHTKHLSKSVLGLEQLANEMIEHHDLRNFKSSSHHLRRSELEQSRTSIISDPVALMAKFRAQERIELGEALDLIMRAKAVMSREPNILRLDAPVIVVGDVHGQFFDLVNIMSEAAKSTGKGLDSQQIGGPMYLFLGDYVDRGQYSCEVMLYLLSLKVAFPERVWLVRGNHECASVSGHFGFKEECKTKYGMNIYYSFLLMFQTMPLGAIISTAFGDIYACHGGLSPGLQTIESIEVLDRMVEPESNPNLMDILWADPISDENVENMSAEQYQEFINIDWRPNPSRGCSYCYGYKTVKRFLETNALVCLVRAHEVQEEGYRKHFAPEIMESKIVTLQQKMHRAALAKEVAAAARMQHSVLHSLHTLHIDTADDDAISTLDPMGEMSTPSAAGVRERMFGGASGASSSATVSTPPHSSPDTKSAPSKHINTPTTAAAKDTTTTTPATHHVHSSSAYSKRGSPYRPDTCSTASIEQPEDFPPVITIFSAPNYCDRYHNKGAILLIDSALNGFRVIQYDCVEHPKTEVRESQTKTLIDLVIATCPYMPTSFRNFVRLAVELGEDVDLDSVNSDNGKSSGGDSDDDSVGGEIVAFDEDVVDAAINVDGEDGNDVYSENNVNNGVSGGNSSRPGSRPSSVQRIHTHSTHNGTQSGNTSPCDTTLHLDHPSTLDTNTTAANNTSNNSIPEQGQTTNAALPTPPKFTRRASKTISLVRQNSLTVPFPVVIQPQPGSSGSDGPSSVGGVSGSISGEGEYVNEENCEEMDIPHSAHMHSIPPLPLQSPRDGTDSGFNENTNPNTINLATNTTANTTNATTNTTNPVTTDTGRLVKRKSNVYIQALASDAINEAHPVRLNLYLEEFKKTYEASLKKGFQISLFELSSDEKPAISVNDLKKRFESSTKNNTKNSFATNERPFAPHPNREVVHDFERGTGISSIMNMFGGSGRISSSGKFRTSFSAAQDTSSETERRRAGVVGNGDDSIGFRDDFYGSGYKGVPKVASHRHSTGGVNTLSLKSLSSDSYHSGFHSAGHSPAKPSTVPRDLSPPRADSHDAADPRTAALLSMHHAEPARHLFTTVSTTSTTSEVPHTAETLDTLETVASSTDCTTGGEAGALDRTPSDSVLFTQSEIMGLRLMFSLFDRSGSNKIAYGDLVAYAEETDDAMGIRDAASALEILDLDGDGFIGILDFIYFARRLKKMHQLAEREEGAL